MHSSTELLLALWTLAVVEGLRVTEVVVPPFLVIGQRARLRCHFALEGEVLYSLKWWKDGSQFYQFIPRNDPKMVVFSVAGVTVNAENSNLHEVELVDVQTSSSGQYRCEVVAEAPTFNTHVLSANMTIIDVPDGPPVVRGLAETYREGDVIRLNCTSYRSRPPPRLSWEVERKFPHPAGGYTKEFTKVAGSQVIRYRPVANRPDVLAPRPSSPSLPRHPTYTVTLGLVLEAHRRSASRGFFKLRCRSMVYKYEWATEVTVQVENSPVVEPHHLPTLLNTGAAIKASSNKMQGCIWLMIFTVILSCFVQLRTP